MARIDLGKVVGDSATISVGNVTTLEAGENATVVNTGTELNGVFDFGIPKGPKGDKGDTGSQGPVGPQGVQGKAFTIDKTYSSVLDMEADFNNMEVGSYVMIASNVESEDNARLYYRDTNEWKFISDFSGATGIQGEQGPQGQAGYTPVKGVDYFTSADIAEIEGDIKEITGELANLDTTDKSNLVSAINEVASAGGGSKTYVIEDYTKDWITNSESIAKFNSWYQDYLNNIPSSFIIRTRMQDTINYGSVTKTFLLEQFDMISNTKLMLFSSYEGANPTKRYYFQISLTITNNEVTAIVANTGSAVNGIGPKLTSAYQSSGSNVQFALTTDNTKLYTPTANYNPSTKLYTDTTAERTILTKSGLSIYSTSATYQEGDYIYRSNDLTIYKCNTADTTGTWDASKWDSKTYMEYLSDTLVGGALNGSY